MQKIGFNIFPVSRYLLSLNISIKLLLSQERETDNLKKNSNEIYVCLKKNLGDDQEELKKICQRFSGTTQSLTYLRKNLIVKEFVQLLNYFPEFLTSQVSNYKPIGEVREILIKFDACDDDNDFDSQESFTSLKSQSISTNESSNVLLSDSSFSGSSSEEFIESFQTSFCIKKDSFTVLNVMNKMRAKGYEKTIEFYSEPSADENDATSNDDDDMGRKLKLRNGREKSTKWNLEPTTGNVIPKKETPKSSNGHKIFNTRNLFFVSMIVLSTFIAYKYSNFK